MTNRTVLPLYPAAALLSPQEAAFRLLEAATLRGYRTGGLDGIQPVPLDQSGRRVAYRAGEVQGVAERIASGGAGA